MEWANLHIPAYESWVYIRVKTVIVSSALHLYQILSVSRYISPRITMHLPLEITLRIVIVGVIVILTMILPGIVKTARISRSTSIIDTYLIER